VTPELVGVLIERFGLPIAVLSIFVYLILTGKLRPGTTVDRQEADDKAEIQYRELLRSEERTARLEAEKRLAEAVAANRELTDGFRELERTVLRDQRRSSSSTTGRPR
jgi:hypothetical protein